MSLFQCLETKLEVVPAPVVLQTPLGNIHLNAMIDGTEITGESPTNTHRLPSGGWLAGWHRKAFDLELLVCRPLFTLPVDAPLTDCWAGLWRLRANAMLDTCTFTAIWEVGYTWEEGGPNSGQFEYTKTWDDGQTEVSIGTDDGDFLAIRSRRGDGLPTEWESYFLSSPNQFDWFWLQSVHIDVGNNGLAAPLPPLKAGGECQIHFAVAWSPKSPLGASGFAVARGASEILAGANCS